MPTPSRRRSSRARRPSWRSRCTPVHRQVPARHRHRRRSHRRFATTSAFRRPRRTRTTWCRPNRCKPRRRRPPVSSVPRRRCSGTSAPRRSSRRTRRASHRSIRRMRYLPRRRETTRSRHRWCRTIARRSPVSPRSRPVAARRRRSGRGHCETAASRSRSAPAPRAANTRTVLRTFADLGRMSLPASVRAEPTAASRAVHSTRSFIPLPRDWQKLPVASRAVPHAREAVLLAHHQFLPSVHAQMFTPKCSRPNVHAQMFTRSRREQIEERVVFDRQRAAQSCVSVQVRDPGHDRRAADERQESRTTRSPAVCVR